MLIPILILLFLVALAFSLLIKWIVFYHFKKFSLPEDPMVKKIIKLHKWGTIIIVSFCVLILIFGIIKT